MTIARPFLTFGDGEDGEFTAIICHIWVISEFWTVRIATIRVHQGFWTFMAEAHQ
jgi:hypothetical protein